MLRGTFWNVLMRWSIRAIGLINVVILARLLTPDDFGIVAMGIITMALLESFANLNVTSLIIREKNLDRATIDTAWSMQFLQNLALAFILAASAPLIATYFGDPRVTDIILVLAIATSIRGLTNIGMTLVRRELDYAKDFRFEVYKKLSIFSITLALALSLQSYWAIVIGQLAGAVIEVILSFLMHSYRPRPQLKNCRRFLNFGLIMSLTNTLQYLNQRFDSWVVAGISNAATFGLYNIALELSRMIINEITTPVNRALYPAYAKISHDREGLAEIYLNTLGIIITLYFALGIGLHMVADEMVRVILGEKWLDAIPIIEWLALLALFEGIFQMLAGNVVNVIHKEKAGLYLHIGRFIMIAPAIIVASLFGDIITIAMTAALATAAYIPITIGVAARLFGVGSWRITILFWRPVLAGMVMGLSIEALHVSTRLPILGLVLDILVGALTYTSALLALWFLAGRPDGAERQVLDKFRKKLHPRA